MNTKHIAFCAGILFMAGNALAVTYDESIDGDLSDTFAGLNTIILDVGVNTISGQSVAVAGVEPVIGQQIMAILGAEFSHRQREVMGERGVGHFVFGGEQDAHADFILVLHDTVTEIFDHRGIVNGERRVMTFAT